MKYFLALVGLAIGLAGFVYGEADDSPGLQLLSALLVLGVIVFGVKTARTAWIARHGG